MINRQPGKQTLVVTAELTQAGSCQRLSAKGAFVTDWASVSQQCLLLPFAFARAGKAVVANCTRSWPVVSGVSISRRVIVKVSLWDDAASWCRVLRVYFPGTPSLFLRRLNSDSDIRNSDVPQENSARRALRSAQTPRPVLPNGDNVSGDRAASAGPRHGPCRPSWRPEP